jgi:GTPase
MDIENSEDLKTEKVKGDFKLIKSGFVAILGRPNVGKSTLLNKLIGEKLAITTNKPQTTRENMIGVYNGKELQIGFLDTPGYHGGKKKLNKFMAEKAISSIDDTDIVIIIVDATLKSEKFSEKFGPDEIAKRAHQLNKPIIIVLNKVDIMKYKPSLLPMMEKWTDVDGVKSVIPISAKTGEGIEQLLEETKKYLPEGPAFYPEGMITDRSKKWLASEMIRENIMILLSQELPYSTAVIVDRIERKKSGTYVDARIFVERESQKAIMIGKKGSMIKVIGERGRNSLSLLLKNKVHLFLDVKVDSEWTNRINRMKELGYI